MKLNTIHFHIGNDFIYYQYANSNKWDKIKEVFNLNDEEISHLKRWYLEDNEKCIRKSCKKKCICIDDKYITITPISSNVKNKSLIDYKEQQERYDWMWDDSKFNNSKIGDYFGFFLVESKTRKKGKVIIHKIYDIKNPKYRLKSWSDNIGQTDRNVLILSPEIIEIPMDIWKKLGGGMSKMGTYSTKLNDDIIRLL
jgi:hypothetical protein